MNCSVSSWPHCQVRAYFRDVDLFYGQEAESEGNNYDYSLIQSVSCYGVVILWAAWGEVGEGGGGYT